MMMVVVDGGGGGAHNCPSCVPARVTAHSGGGGEGPALSCREDELNMAGTVLSEQLSSAGRCRSTDGMHCTTLPHNSL